MDKGKLLRLVLIPIIIGLVVTLIVRQVLQSPEAATAKAGPQEETVAVVTVNAKEQIPARTKLTEQQLQLKQMPKSLMTGNEFTAVKDVAGQTSLVALDPGEIVLKSRVVPEGKGSLSYRLKPGMRAMTIRIDELSGVAGYPKPGDLVDLILVLQPKNPDRPNASSRLIYEAIEVLGLGPAPDTEAAAAVKSGSAAGEAPKLTSITLALKPDQAVEVALAEQIGLVKTMLRPVEKDGNAGRIQFNEKSYSEGAAAPAKQ